MSQENVELVRALWAVSSGETFGSIYVMRGSRWKSSLGTSRFVSVPDTDARTLQGLTRAFRLSSSVGTAS